MKLQINRREEKQGLVFKKPLYIIDVTLEVTPEEAALIKKHKWGDIVMANLQRTSKLEIPWSLKNMIGSNKYPCDEIEWAADFEQQVIESARKLKANLEGAAGFVGGGPREIEL
jgi:hypothetical protein